MLHMNCCVTNQSQVSTALCITLAMTVTFALLAFSAPTVIIFCLFLLEMRM